MQRAWALIESTLRRHSWAIILVAIIPCAYFAAMGTNHAIVANVFRTDVAALSRPVPTSLAALAARPAPPPSQHQRDVDRILARNVFDADAGCLNCAPPPAPAEADAGAGEATATNYDNRDPDPCTGSARVLGAVQADDPLWSFVFLAQGASGPSLPYRFGQQFDGRTVTTIGWHQRFGAFVVLRQGAGGPRCFYAQIMPPHQAAPPPPPTATPVAAPSGESSGEMNAILDRIERAGPNEFNIPRSAVDRILENQADLMRTTRIMPQTENGRTTGVQMFGVRGNSLLGRLGMQNGDVLSRINGLEIASPDRALEAYSRLRTADHITLSVTRNGQPVNLDFNIR